MNASSLEVFKARLDGALRNMVYWEVSLLIAEVLKLYDLKDPFQDKPVDDFIQKEEVNLPKQ